jgi:hypothetical protein
MATVKGLRLDYTNTPIRIIQLRDNRWIKFSEIVDNRAHSGNQIRH